MALYKAGGGIIQLSGSIAGNTFARNRFGFYIRPRTKPVNPNTEHQQAIRNTLALLSNRWARTLTMVQREAWRTYAANVPMKNRLGETIYLTGPNHYLRSNIERQRSSYTIIDNGPVIFELPAKDNTLSLTASEETQVLTINYSKLLDWANEDGGYMWFYQGMPQNRQRQFFGGPWRLVGCQDGSSADPHDPPYLAKALFPIASQQRQWIYARITRADGRLSEPFRADCFCGA